MIVSVLNNKGGTGKTTTAVNLATATAIEGKKTLIVDLDPQGNATTGLGFEKATLSSTVYNVLSQSLKAAFDYRIILTMYDRRTALSRRVMQQVNNNFGERVLKSVIPRSVRMAEAPSKGLPGILYRPRNPASEQYRVLAKELLQVQPVAIA